MRTGPPKHPRNLPSPRPIGTNAQYVTNQATDRVVDIAMGYYAPEIIREGGLHPICRVTTLYLKGWSYVRD